MNNVRFSLIKRSNQDQLNSYRILFSGPRIDLTKYASEIANDIASFLECEIFIRNDDQNLDSDELNDFHLIIYIASKQGLIDNPEDRYLFNLKTKATNGIYIALDEWTYHRLSYEYEDKIVLCKNEIYSKKDYLTLLKATFNDNYISNAYLQRMRNATCNDFNFAYQLAKWFGINSKRDLQCSYLAIYKNEEDIESNGFVCYTDYYGFSDLIYGYHPMTIEFDQVIANYLKDNYLKNPNFENFRRILTFLNMKFRKFGTNYSDENIHDDDIENLIDFYIKTWTLYGNFISYTLPILLHILIARINSNCCRCGPINVTRLINKSASILDILKYDSFEYSLAVYRFSMLLINNAKDHIYADGLLDSCLEAINKAYIDDEYVKNKVLTNFYYVLARPLSNGEDNKIYFEYLEKMVFSAETYQKEKPCYLSNYRLMHVYDSALFYVTPSQNKELQTYYFKKFYMIVVDHFHSYEDLAMVKLYLDVFNNIGNDSYYEDLQISYDIFINSMVEVIKAVDNEENIKNPKVLYQALQLYQHMIYYCTYHKNYVSLKDYYFDRYLLLFTKSSLICDFNRADYEKIEDFFNSFISYTAYCNDKNRVYKCLTALYQFYANQAPFSVSSYQYRYACKYLVQIIDYKITNLPNEDISLDIKQLEKLANESNARFAPDDKSGDEFIARALYLKATHNKKAPYDLKMLTTAKNMLIKLRDSQFEGYLNQLIDDINDAINVSGD